MTKPTKTEIILLITELSLLKVFGGIASLNIIQNIELFKGFGLSAILALWLTITIRALTRFSETYNKPKEKTS